MLDDKRLIWKVKNGCTDSLRRIYESHKDDLLTLANALLNDRSAAEDAVHDVFVAFAAAAPTLQLRKNLRGYLVSSVRNLAYDRLRAAKRHGEKLAEFAAERLDCETPDAVAARTENQVLLRRALAALPFEQREVVVLHVRANLTFKQIAAMQDASINTVQGRYRYGIQKLRSLLNGQANP
ncbi:MAG: sigma-70 family RNA polymerase sigma factor [Phycisphaerae bacterium]|nr:sigma-70 family RNA polymerase sigma factor [Phycisphaerae bacterium]